MIWDPVAICLLEMVLSLRERLIFLDQTGKKLGNTAALRRRNESRRSQICPFRWMRMES